MTSLTFNLEGNPLPYREFKIVKGTWSDYKQDQLCRSLELEKQLEALGLEPITTPIHIDFVFSFDVKKGRTRKEIMKHTERPCIEDLIKYINVISRDKLYIPEAVVSVSAKKQWSQEPGTEFKITKL